MKSVLPFVLIAFYFSAFSQQAKVSASTDTFDILPVVLNFHTYGYIDGVRLDSINTQYAEFGLKGADGVSFYYGQNFRKRKDIFVKDNRNIPLIFMNRNRAFLLNFFYHNGWEFVNTTNPQNDGTFVLKKINR
jgi:hypothetical protein